MKLRKTLLISFLLLTAFSLAAGQPSQPLNVYGSVTDSSSGEAVSDVDVEALVDGNVVASATTDSEGFYDLYISDATSGDEVSLEVGGISTGETVTWSSGKVEEVDLEEDLLEGETNESGDETSGGGGGSGSGGGSGGGGLGSLPTENDTDDEDSEEGLQVTANVSEEGASASVQSVEENESVTVSIPEESNTGSVESVSFTAGSSTSDIQVSVRDLEEKPDDVSAPEQEVYGYQEIDVSAPEGSVTSASITFRIPKEDIDTTERSLTEVTLQRYNDGWERLSTSVSDETETHYRFTAESPGFSYYAITFSGEDQQLQEEPVNETESNRTGTEEQQNGGIPPEKFVLYSLAALLMIILVALYGFREQIDDFIASLVSEEN